MRALYGWKFALTIALPLLLASLGVGLLTFELVSRVSTGANNEDRERTRQVVTSALGAIHKQMSDLMSDNAYWDDAARQGYGTPDPDWIEETWGIGTKDGTNYDAMMIVDLDLRQAVTGYRKGQVFTPEPAEYMFAKLEPFLALLPQDHKTFDTKATILKTADGLALVGAAPLFPTSEDITIPQPRPRYLVLIRFLTEDYIAAIGSQYVISGLTITAADHALPGSEVVRDFSGAPVAALQWADRRPGDIARAAVSQKALMVLGFLALVMTGIAILCWRLIRAIGEREAVARHEALHDSLTGLPNRAALYAEISRLVTPGHEPVAVAFADLDGFKDVNDTYDHETGDRLIKVVAVGLSYLAKGRGMVCRLGGDEFVMLLSGKDAPEQACRLANDFIAFLGVPIDLEGKMASVGASIGIAGTGSGTADAQELMRRADIAMYKAKNSGKNRYCEFAAEFDTERNDNLGIAGELRRIVAEGSIEIAYQPVVDARTRTIIGVEALARWPASSPRRITPDRFIRLAETNGLIDDLGDAILAKACATARQWQGIRLAVNISPVQLRNPDFVSRTLKTIAESGMDCRNVELEITESVLLDDVGKAKHIFEELRAAGIQIVLDDFGSGFSSIGYLRQFNFDRIKIDRSLIERVLQGTGQLSIVQGTMLMAAGLTASVTAEGVELEEQIDVLRLTGCTEMQGYYFFKPLPEAEISSLLQVRQFATAEVA
jgi:diguanylate cyclase (GGDEF)-like protein